jgi:magnesium transporter
MIEIGDNGPELRWVVAVDPTPEEIARLRADHGVPEELTRHALDVDEVPRTDSSGDAVLIVLRVPVFRAEAIDVPYGTIPLGLVLAPGRVVVVSRSANDVVDTLRARLQSEREPEPRHRLILHALQLTADAYLAHVRRINTAVDRLEDRLARALENREVLELLKCQKGFVYFGTALRAMELLIERLRKTPLLAIPEEDHELLDDVMVEVRQAIYMTTTSGNILSEMMDAFASIISNNLNVVMKFLAGVTVVLTLPATVAAFFGMNVTLPGLGFGAIVGVTIVLSLALATLLRRMRWL